MARGTTSPPISIPLSRLRLTRISATGSPDNSRWLSSSREPPMACRISMVPLRVGLTPTLLHQQFGTGDDQGGDQEEGGRRDIAGDKHSRPCSVGRPVSVTPPAKGRTSAPK